MSSMRTRTPIMFCLPLALGLIALAIARQNAGAADDAADNGGGELTGVVKFDGPKPERKPIDMTPSKGGAADECTKLHQDAALSEVAMVSDDGGVANVFVYVKKGLEKGKKYPMPEQPALIDQSKCMYRPRVQGVRVGQDLVIKNSDMLTHNTRSYAFRNRAFNISQPAGSDQRTKVFNRPERAIQLGCDFHSWMKAYVFAMDHPFFAVTDQEGHFKIEGLPPGKYTVEAWHEEFGELEAEATVGPTGSTELDFTFKDKQS